MTKLLIALLFLITAPKCVAGFLKTSYEVGELVMQGEENDQQKAEDGKAKKEIEDKICSHALVGRVLNTPAKLSRITSCNDLYQVFENSPATPPPDTI